MYGITPKNIRQVIRLTSKPSAIALPPSLAAALARQQYRKPPSQEEHYLQVACVRWFRHAYKDLDFALFAVPNGAFRNKTTAAKLKAEGVLAGVADLILLVRTQHYGALLIEMKTPKGVQSDCQKQWQKRITQNGRYKYVICRSKQDFVREIEAYLADRQPTP